MEPAGACVAVPEPSSLPAGGAADDRLGHHPRRWFRDGRQHKASALDRLAADFPTVRWILIGDDGEHDPEIYADFASTHPTHVAAVALRQVRTSGSRPDQPPSGRDGGIPIVRGADGDELLPLLLQCLRGHGGRTRRQHGPTQL